VAYSGTSDTANASVAPNDFVLRATDNYPLAARLWADPALPSVSAVAVINAGAGIGLGYYNRFACFLAESGIPTLIYDYRGIGQSRPRVLRRFHASVEDWGSKDCAAALAWLAAQFPRARRVVIGHSVGGFVTGFVTNGPMIDRMLLIGAHTGYWRDYSARTRPAMYLVWHAMMPAVTRVIGYFPGRRLRLLEDLPAGVALEWANRRKPEFWWNRTTPDGAPDTLWKESALRRFYSIRARTLAVRFTDDAFATEKATERILGLYQNCRATKMVLSPAVVGGQKIGHFGFFRSRFRDSLWVRIADWLHAEMRADGALRHELA
jgi:predicted alpha/beta hydrolase